MTIALATRGMIALAPALVIPTSTASLVTRIADDLAAYLGAISGVQTVYKVGDGIDLSALVADTDFPVILLKTGDGSPTGAELSGPTAMVLRTTTFQIVAINNGRTAGDDDWQAEDSEAMEASIMEAVMTDHTRGGLARNTEWTGTQQNPEMDGVQVDSSVGMTFDVLHRHRVADLEEQSP